MSGSSLGLLCLKITQTAFSGGWAKVLQDFSNQYPSGKTLAIVLSRFSKLGLEKALQDVPAVGTTALVVEDLDHHWVWFWRQEVTADLRAIFRDEEGEIVVFQVER